MYKVSALLEAIIPRHRFCNSEWHWGRAREHGIMHNFREALGEICPPPCARWLIPRSLCSAVLCARDILESAAVTALISYAGGKSFRRAQSSSRYPLDLARNSSDLRSNYFCVRFGDSLSMKSTRKLISTTFRSGGRRRRGAAVRAISLEP